jgi:integrase
MERMIILMGGCLTGQKNETRPREIPMTKQVRQVLLEWWIEQGRPEKGWVFPSDKKKHEGEADHRPLWSFHTTHKRMFGEHAFRKNRGKGKRTFPHRWKQYGLKFPNGQSIARFRLYDLRHTYLTRLGENGVGEIEIMKLAGWSSTRMASHYVHPSKARIGRAVRS